MTRTYLVTLFLVMLLAANGSFAQDPVAFWEFQHPAPQGNTLRSVKMLDSLTYVAVGDVGTIIKTTNDGGSWKISARTLGYGDILNSVDFGDKAHGACVGRNGFIFYTNDSGNTWKRATSSSVIHLNDVHFYSPKTVFAVGNGGTILRSDDSAKSWTQIVFETKEHLKVIAFPTSSHGIIGATNGLRYITNDSGKNWEAYSDAYANNIFGMSFYTGAELKGKEGAMCGEAGGVWLTHDSGATWMKQAISPGGSCNDIIMLSPLKSICVSDFYGLWITTDGGVSWNDLLPYRSTQLKGISFCDERNGVVVGTNGIILRSSNGGLKWDAVFDRIVDQLYGLYSVWCIDSLKAVACGSSGLIVSTTDGGKVWKSQYDTAYTPLYSINFQTALIGTAVGASGRIIRTRDGGKTWTPQLSPTGAILRAVSFLDTSNGIAVGEKGVIIMTQTGGKSWFYIHYPDNDSSVFTGVSYFAPNRAVICGAIPGGDKDHAGVALSVLLRATDGGFTWKKPSCPDSLKAAEFYSVSFPTPKIGFAGGSIGEGVAKTGPVFRSDDSGKTWRHIGDAAASMFGLSFKTTLIGTCVGLGGFTAHTNDGGLTWRSVESGTSLNLYGVHHSLITSATAVGLKTAILRLTTNDTLMAGVESSGASIAPKRILLGNYPNPFRSLTSFALTLGEPERITLAIYDEKGERVEQLFEGLLPEGEHTIGWDASRFASGIYFARLEASGASEMIKIVIQK